MSRKTTNLPTTSLPHSRRHWMRSCLGGGLAASSAPWLSALAANAAESPERKRSCILLWMTGGPSQIDTFDPKPEHSNGGEFKSIDTSVSGIQIGEHLPQLAKQMEHVSLVRSMKTREGDHSRATYLMRTGYLPQGPVQYPTMGSLFSHELGREQAELPNFVSINPYRFLSPAAYGPGFLGPQASPLVVGSGNVSVASSGNGDAIARALKVKKLDRPEAVNASDAKSRLDLLKDLEREFAATRPDITVQSHQAAYQQAVRMMNAEGVKAFDLTGEKDKLRDAYGRNLFGQSCLLARRLVERGVPFVEVSLNSAQNNMGLGWDTHQNNFGSVKRLCEILDPAWATLLSDLKQRGLLENTLVVWMGEFGRTPRINRNQGRDHFANAWSTALCGGGIRGGQVIGKTSDSGMQVNDRPVSVPDLLATVCGALEIDPKKQNMSNIGRPIRVVDVDAKPIKELIL